MNNGRKSEGKGLAGELLKGIPPWAKFILALLVVIPAWYGGSGQFFGFGEAADKAHKGYRIFRKTQDHNVKEIDALRGEIAQLRMLFMYAVVSKSGEMDAHDMVEVLDRYSPDVPKPEPARDKPPKPSSLSFEDDSLDDLLGVGVGSGIGSGGGGAAPRRGSKGARVEIGEIEEVKEAKEGKKAELPKPDKLKLPPMKSQKLVEQRPAMPAAL